VWRWIRDHIRDLLRTREVALYVIWVGCLGGAVPVIASLFVFLFATDSFPGAAAISNGGALWLLSVGFLMAALVPLTNSSRVRDRSFNAMAAGVIGYSFLALTAWVLVLEANFEGAGKHHTFEVLAAITGVPYAIGALTLGALAVRLASE
jgi:hypothetical protein